MDIRSVGLDHARYSRLGGIEAHVVRPPRNDEADPQHAPSRTKEPCQGTSDPTPQFHDDSASISLWISRERKPRKVHVNSSILIRARRLDELKMHQYP